MTSIKPKDMPGAAGVSGGTSGEPSSVERAGEGFRDALERAGKTGSASAIATTTASGAAAKADPITDLARAVQSGALSVDRALEQLVERAAGAMAGKLTSAQRAELTAVLQAALQNDPALQSLRERIG
jgi:hypothetical protein